jgi:hypothetical protein
MSMKANRGAATVLFSVLAVGSGIALAASGQELATDQPSQQALEDLVEKRAIEAREERLIEQGRASPAPVPADPLAAAPDSPPPAWPEGIFGRQEADFPPALGYEFQNIWRQVIGGQYVTVLAGSLIDNPRQGIVMVKTIDPETWGHTFQRYVTPIPGPVRITAAQGVRVTLTSDTSEAMVEFDVRSGSFA